MRPQAARVRVPLPQSGGSGAKVKDITAGTGEAAHGDQEEEELSQELDEPLTASLPRSNSRQSRTPLARADSPKGNSFEALQGESAQPSAPLPRSDSSLAGSQGAAALQNPLSRSSYSRSQVSDATPTVSKSLPPAQNLQNSLSRSQSSRSRSRPSRSSNNNGLESDVVAPPAMARSITGTSERSLSRQSSMHPPPAAPEKPPVTQDEAPVGKASAPPPPQRPQGKAAARSSSREKQRNANEQQQGELPPIGANAEVQRKFGGRRRPSPSKEEPPGRPAQKAGRGSTSAPPVPKPAPAHPQKQQQQQQPQPKRRAPQPSSRSRSEPPPGNKQGQLAKLVMQVTSHLQESAEPVDEKGWLQETAQLELFVEEMRYLMSQQHDPPTASPNAAAAGRQLPAIAANDPRKRDISVLQWDKDLRWAKQQLRRCEQEYTMLQQRMACIDPVAQEQLAADIRQVEEDIAAEQKRQKLLVAENRQRERSLVRNAVDGHEVDAKTRALQQIERFEAELAVWKVKNNSLHKQVQEATRLLQKAQENRMLLGKKAQHMDEVINSEEFAVKQAEQREAAERFRHEESELQATLIELQEQRKALQKNNERRKRERNLELRQLNEEKRILEDRERHAEATVRQLRRQIVRESPTAAGTPARVGRAPARSASPRQMASPSGRNHDSPSVSRSPPRIPSKSPDSKAQDHGPAKQPEASVAPAAQAPAKAPLDDFETQVQNEATRFADLLPSGLRRVCILGSTVMHGSDTKSVVEALSRAFASSLPSKSFVTLTGGNSGVQATFVQEYPGDASLIYNLVLQGTQSDFGQGTDLEVHGDAALKSALMGEIGDIYVTVEGGPRVAEEARRAILRGATVVALSKTGGASAGAYGFPPAALKRPSSLSQAVWQQLQAASSADEIAAATVKAIQEVLKKEATQVLATADRAALPQEDDSQDAPRVRRPSSRTSHDGEPRGRSPSLAHRRISQASSD
mmetsp:Transcript_22626/g.52775  ORF Transcript_22626/g.52775 Transcript_22626/m.52775 type:complete len:974 (-) Transcript_22626:57-2978(-)